LELNDFELDVNYFGQDSVELGNGFHDFGHELGDSG